MHMNWWQINLVKQYGVGCCVGGCVRDLLTSSESGLWCYFGDSGGDNSSAQTALVHIEWRCTG